MDEPIVVVDANTKQRQEVCSLLEHGNYRTIAFSSLDHLEKATPESAPKVLILDLDSLTVDNRIVRGLKERVGTYIIGLSKRYHHPGLEEAMAQHIYACLIKPLDIEELFYLLKTIYQNNRDPYDPSNTVF